MSIDFSSRGAVCAAVAGVVCAAMTSFVQPAEARITRIQITSRQSPTFLDSTGTAKTFGSVGTYEKLRGRAYGEVDPNDPHNSGIVDLALAPRNARGMVEYSMDIYILKPTDLGLGNHKLFMEVNNRGGKLFGGFNLSAGGNDPTTATDAGDGFLMNQGYAMAWNGWDISAAGSNALTISVPIATNPDGSSITGRSYEYIVNDNATTQTVTLAYPAATLDTTQAVLTRKAHLDDVPEVVASTGWEFTTERTIRLLPAGTAFQQSWIYELTYTAKDPLVAGLGFAATRDFLSFLRHQAADDFGNPNPLLGSATEVYGFTVSQPARYMNDFISLGFNQDEAGHIVFDGLENWIGAGNGVALNFRFAQPGRTERNRQNHLYPEASFPFSFTSSTDPFTGRIDGRSERCAATNTCPKTLHIISANEYWVKAGSLVHTDAQGRELPDPADMRYYLISSIEHTVSGAPLNSRGTCQQYRNPMDPNPALRALFVALDQWVTVGVEPPPSQVPRVSDGTAVFPIFRYDGMGYVPQASLGWPSIPGVTYTGVMTIRHKLDWGAGFDQGILTNNPPAFFGPVYKSFVSRVDRDGNEVAGIRLPPIAAPTATHSGWALRAAAFGGNDGCEASGQYIPFAATAADRAVSGDPRLSLEERYGDHAGYVAQVRRAANKLAEKRLLLPADVQRYVDAADASTVLR